MRPIAFACLFALCAACASAQTRIAFSTPTDHSGFTDEGTKSRQKALAFLVDDFTAHQKQDQTIIVADRPDVAIVITARTWEAKPNQTTTTPRPRIGGGIAVDTKAAYGSHLIVELHAGDYATTFEGWDSRFSTDHGDVARQIRRWLKDNRAKLPR